MSEITKVYLLNVPLESDYKNTLYFTSKANQQAFFESKIVKSFTDFSYQRKDFTIRIPEHFDNLLGCNYVMYQNTKYSNKWFYAFITDMKYVDDGRTDIEIETDVIQTWFFDYNVKASFVEREHASTDNAGDNLQPENLEIGEYVINNNVLVPEEIEELLTDCVYILSSTHTPIRINGEFIPFSDQYNGIYSACSYWVVQNLTWLRDVINVLTKDGKADAITGLFMVPKFLAPSETLDFEDYPSPDLAWKVLTSDTANVRSLDVPKPTTLGTYTPRNKKLLTYPFQYLLVSNNAGGSGLFNWEDFKSNTENKAIFLLKGAISPGGSIRLVPYQYKNVQDNEEYGVTLGKYPICSYPVDMYTNWLTQNSINVGLDVVSAGVNAIGGGVSGFAIGGPAGAVAGASGGLMDIARSVGQVHVASLQPYQARGNLNSGDVNFASGNNKFHFYPMCIREEFAKVIDGFFDMFGYKTNRVKVPNKAHRSRWWYTKTVDVNIDGAIPNKDMQIIKNCYNNGITFWRNASEIQDYSLSNGISITE